MAIFISHGDCEENDKQLMDLLKQRHGMEVTMLTEIGPVIGSHAGPDTITLFLIGKCTSNFNRIKALVLC